MKVSAIVLALYSAMLCVHAASLELLKVNETRQKFHVGNVGGIDSLNVPTLEESNLGCPDGPPTSENAPLMERAICPWYLNSTRDVNRLPEVIEEAVCRCKGCLTGGTCVPNYADIPILIKNPGGEFKSTKLKIAVSCNCVW